MIKLNIDFENDSDEEVGEKLWLIYISQDSYDGALCGSIFNMASEGQLKCFDDVRSREQAKQEENDND